MSAIESTISAQGEISGKISGIDMLVETGAGKLAAVTSYVHDLLRLHECASLNASRDLPELRSPRRVDRLPPSQVCRQVEARAYALSVAGETLVRLGGRTLLDEIIRATELHYGLPAALLLGQQWASHGRGQRVF